MAVIGPVWVNGSFFGSVYIMLRLDSGDFWMGLSGFGWFQVVSGGFGWFRVGSDGFGWVRVVSGFINNAQCDLMDQLSQYSDPKELLPGLIWIPLILIHEMDNF